MVFISTWLMNRKVKDENCTKHKDRINILFSYLIIHLQLHEQNHGSSKRHDWARTLFKKLNGTPIIPLNNNNKIFFLIFSFPQRCRAEAKAKASFEFWDKQRRSHQQNPRQKAIRRFISIFGTKTQEKEKKSRNRNREKGMAFKEMGQSNFNRGCTSPINQVHAIEIKKKKTCIKHGKTKRRERW